MPALQQASAEKKILVPYTPVPSGVPVHQPFSDHIPADRAEIIIEIGNNDIDLALRIDPVILEFLHDHIQNNPFFLALGRNRLQLAILKESVDYFLTIYGVVNTSYSTGFYTM